MQTKVYNLGVLTKSQTVKDAVSIRNPVDLLKFRLTRRSSLTVELKGLRANASIQLLNSRQRRIGFSNLKGNRAESISRTLNSGTYYIRVDRISGRTAYTLKLQSDSPQPSTPTGLNRSESLAFYNNFYQLSTSPEINWTGSFAANSPGTTSDLFKDAVVRRVNYFRAMAGVPADVVLDPTFNRKAQAAAFIMSANKALSHTPPTTWQNYSAEGAEGAGNSNLALYIYGWNAINGYMEDSGDGNYAAGHRRWLLYPQTQRMGTGDIPGEPGRGAANALWVFDANTWEPRPTVRETEGFVAWPPRGYVPDEVVYPRWSFSLPNADFTSASVTMTQASGALVPLTQERVRNGYGENTLVWRPYNRSSFDSWPDPVSDENYTVAISNVLVNGTPRSFTYQVTVFDVT